MRVVEGAERDPNGATCQLVAAVDVHNFPVPLEKFVVMYREVDLAKKEWFQDCTAFHGEVIGSPDWASLVHSEISSPLLPITFDQVVVRHFALCSKSPVDGLCAGVLVSEVSPPSGVEACAGFKIPKPRRRVIRMELKAYQYVTPGALPNTTKTLIIAELGAPVPSWMIPMSLLARFVADFFTKTLVKLKQEVIDKFAQYPFDDRMVAQSAFYQAVAGCC